MKCGTNTRMAEVFQRISSMECARCELLPGPFGDSDMQLAVVLPRGVHLSVLPDADVSALFEVVRLDGSDPQLKDKLPLDGVVALIESYLAGPEAASTLPMQRG